MGVSKFIYLFFIFSLLSLVSAVNLDYGVVLNTSVSNSSMTFFVPITVDNFNITAFNITLNTIICSNGADPISQIVWDTPNANNDSAEYCIVAPPTPAPACTASTNASFRLIMIFAGLMIFLVVGLFVWRQGMEITLGQIMLLAITLILGVIFWQVAGQNLGSVCPVT